MWSTRSYSAEGLNIRVEDSQDLFHGHHVRIIAENFEGTLMVQVCIVSSRDFHVSIDVGVSLFIEED